MTYYADLTPYVYWPEHVFGDRPYPDGVEALNVGWLEAGHVFPTFEGDPDPQFLKNLITLVADHSVCATRGFHGCDQQHEDGKDFQFQSDYDGRDLFLGSAEIHVVTPDGRWLIAPNLVVHYVRDHGYRPPEEFIEAVKAMRVAPVMPNPYLP